MGLRWFAVVCGSLRWFAVISNTVFAHLREERFLGLAQLALRGQLLSAAYASCEERRYGAEMKHYPTFHLARTTPTLPQRMC